MTLALGSSDIQSRHDIVMPGAWTGENLDVTLFGTARGTLIAVRQVDPNTWHMRWSRSDSPLDGRTFELARMISTFHVRGQLPDWNCRLSLVE